ncbi:MAG: hypothetical protein D6765_09925 [Bacteroidetes bacterium]|nr:MAG: hypothetical protein D6765_09925 [Bacteroidota bacterium]
MKTPFALALALLSGTLLAQTTLLEKNLFWDHQMQTVQALSRTFRGEVIVFEGALQMAFPMYPKYIAFTPDGEVIGDGAGGIGSIVEWGFFSSHVQLADGNHLIIHFGDQCDVCCQGMLSLRDENFYPIRGEWLMTAGSGPPRYDRFPTAAPHAGGYILADYNTYGHYRVDGIPNWERAHSFELIADIEMFGADSILLVTEQGFVLADVQGAPFDTLENMLYQTLEKRRDEGWVGVSGNRLDLLKPHFAVSQTIQFNAPILDVAHHPDSSWIAVLDEERKITLLDYHGFFLNIFPLQLPEEAQPTSLKFLGEALMVGGHEFYAPPALPTGFVKSYSVQGESYDPNSDIAILDAWNVYPSITGSLPVVSIRMPEANLRIENRGADTLHRFVAALKFTGLTGMYCLGTTFFDYNADLSLPPGQAIDLTFKELDIPNFVTGILSIPEEIEVCFYLIAPNDHLDVNHADNMLCQTILLTDVQEPTRDDSAVQVLPLPDGSGWQLSRTTSPSKIWTLRLLSTDGRLLHTIPWPPHTPTLELRTPQLPAGLYLLHLLKPEGSTARKVFRTP